MSTLKTGALRGTSGTADSVQLHASNQSVTFPGAVTVAGALTSSTTALGLYSGYAYLRDIKDDVDGGSTSVNTIQDRDLNEEVFDIGNIVTLASNKFTIGPGDFIIKWSCPGLRLDEHASRLYDVTNSAVAGKGQSAFSNDADTYAQTRTEGVAKVTISSGTVEYKIQHWSSKAKSGNGLGANTQSGSFDSQKPIYTTVEIWKLA